MSNISVSQCHDGMLPARWDCDLERRGQDRNILAQMSTLYPASVAGRYSSPPSKVPRQVALIGKSGGKGYLRQRKLGLTEHPLHLLQASIQKITVRWHSDGLVECASEMMRGQPGEGSQIVEAHFLVQVRVNVLADPLGQCRRQPAAARRCRLVDGRM